MVIAIIVLSIVVLLLLIALAACAIALIDANARANCLSETLRNVEDKHARGAELVYQKFGFRVPFSESCLRLAEMKLEESKRQGGEA
jgi:hypothetical protein